MFSTTHIAYARRVQWHDGTCIFTQDVVEELIVQQYIPCHYITYQPQPFVANGRPWNNGDNMYFRSRYNDQEPLVIQDLWYEDDWNQQKRNFRLKKSNFYIKRFKPYDIITRNARDQKKKVSNNQALHYYSDTEKNITGFSGGTKNNKCTEKLNATLIGQRRDDEQKEAAEINAETKETELKKEKQVERNKGNDIEIEKFISGMNSMENYLLKIVDDDSEGEASSELGVSLQIAPKDETQAHHEPLIKQTLFREEVEESKLAQESGEDKCIFKGKLITNNCIQSSDDKHKLIDKTCSEETEATDFKNEWEAKDNLNGNQTREGIINMKHDLSQSLNEHVEGTLPNVAEGSWKEESADEADKAVDSSLGLIAQIEEGLPIWELGVGRERSAEAAAAAGDGLKAAGEEALPAALRAVSVEASAEEGDRAGGRWWSRAARVLRRRCGLSRRRRDASADARDAVAGRASWQRLLCCAHHGGDD